jgi:hypothetical protein
MDTSSGKPKLSEHPVVVLITVVAAVVVAVIAVLSYLDTRPQPVIPTPSPSPTTDNIQTVEAQTTSTNAPSTESPTPIRFSCSWSNDWELQANGSYLWIGSQPGSAACPKVGQEGDILARMDSGECLTLAVEVGDTPLPLAICLNGVQISGTFIPSSLDLPCYDDKVTTEDQFPTVQGLVEITCSKGFAIGYTP